MKFLTSGQIKDFEAKAITDLSSSLRLINSAANACAKELSHFGAICIFCGKGNNGADGYRIAELLRRGGRRVYIVRTFEPETDECRYLAKRCEEERIPSFTFEEACEGGRIPRCDAVVDAIFGIGIHGTVTGVAAKAIERINSLDAFVLSVDVPSGLDADSGSVCGLCVRADKTVTFTAPKMGMLSGESVDCCGTVVVRRAGVPVDWSLVPEEQPSPLIEEEVIKLLPPRPRLSHKGTFGRAVMIVGSPGMLGAAAIAAKAALKSGVGLVTIVTKRGLENTMNILVPEAVVLPLEEYDVSNPALESALIGASSVLIGCGLGRSVSAEFIASVLDTTTAPTVIDADGLNILAARPELLKHRNVVITPHPLEFSRLTGRSVEEIEKDRLGAARSFAGEYGISLVLKGARTVVSEPGGSLAASLQSTSALAKAGSGDALAGVICALCAQGLSPVGAARLGVYLHARAGIMAGRLCGEYSAAVGDIVDSLKYAFMEVSGHERQSMG